ncbi:hypothetical protein D3C80_197460 [compost metagenome]
MAVDLGVADAVEGRRQAGDLVHDLGRVAVVHRVAQSIGQGHGRLPVGLAGQRLHDLAHPRNAPLGVGEGAVLFQERTARQEHMGELGRFVEEDVLHHHAFHGQQGRGDVLGVGVALGNVLALAVQGLEAAVQRRFEHVGDAQARVGLQGHAPGTLELGAHALVGNVPVAGQLVGERAHVARALHVVLPAQRVHPYPFAADVAGGHGQVGDAHHRGAALAVLGHAQAVVDGRVAAGGVQPGGGADLLGRYAADRAKHFGGVFRQADEVAPAGEIFGFAAGIDEALGQQAFGDDHVGQGVEHGHVGTGAQLQVQLGAGVRRVDQVDAPWVDHDQPRTLAQAALELRAEYRVGVGGVGADHQHHVGLHHRVEALCTSRLTQSLLQAIAGGRMANPRAGVDVVVAERRAHQFLHQVGFFVGATAGGDAADGVAPVLQLDAAEFAGRVGHRLVPADFLPGVVDVLADHRLGDAVRVGGVAPGEAALDAGVAVVGAAVLVRDHAHQLVALHFGAERAADAAIGAGGDDRTLGLAQLYQALFRQGRGRAGLHAGAARHALGGEEVLTTRRRHSRFEATPGDGQGEGALDILAGTHTAAADDALARLVVEVRVGYVLFLGQVVGAVVAVAHLAQAHLAGHGLQLAVAVGRAGQAVQRVVGNVQLHHVAAQAGQARGFGAHHHAFADRRGAGRRVAAHAFDFHHAHAARAEGFEAVGGAQFGNAGAEHGRGTHHRGTGGHSDGTTIDAQADLYLAVTGRGAEVAAFIRSGVEEIDHCAASVWVSPKSAGKYFSALATG